MIDSDQSQGTTEEVKPEVQEKLAEMKQESQTRAERSKTVDERLEKLTQKAEPENQPEPPPSSDQKQTEEVKPQPELKPQDEDQSKLPASEDEKTALENSKNPQRTAEYIEKLKTENQRLREERRKAAGNSVFDSLRPIDVAGVDTSRFGNLNPQSINDITQDFIGPDGVDVDGLNKALRFANDRVTIAETEARAARQYAQQVDERTQVEKAHSLFPELDPTDTEKFDPNFYDLVALKIAKSGMKLTLAEAANDVRKTYASSTNSVNLNKVRDEAVSQYKDNLEKRNQEPLSTSQGEPRNVEVSTELRERTRKGDAYALDERLRKLGLIK